MQGAFTDTAISAIEPQETIVYPDNGYVIIWHNGKLHIC